MTIVAWLTSTDSMYWDLPRRVQVVDVRPGPEQGAAYARLEVDADQADGPMTLLARARLTSDWVPPVAGTPVPILVWTVDEPAAVWTQDGIRPPSPRPSAWCTLAASEAEAQRVGNSALGPGEVRR